MLSQISHSSKRLGKLKKYKTKLDGSGFDFLLQSMDRDKENHVPNALPIQYGQLTRSVNIDSQPTVPAFHNNPMLLSTKPQKIYIENVKVIDCSDDNISEVSQFNNSKQSMRNYFSNKEQGKTSKVQIKSMKQSVISSNMIDRCQLNTMVQKRGNKSVDRYVFDELCSKVEKYLILSNQLISSAEISGKQQKKVNKYSQQILLLLHEVGSSSTQNLRATKNVHKRSDSNICPKDKRQSGQYMKVITRLQSQRQKLNTLISKHELANIKMFVKINEGESDEIQKCKKQLALLFNKYKELENIIKTDKKKILVLTQQKEEIQVKYRKLIIENQQLNNIIENMKNSRIGSPSSVFLEVSSSDIRERNLLKPYHARQDSGQSYLENSMNRRGELRIQSLRNSCFSYEEEAPRSSITTVTERQQKKVGSVVGINLNTLVESIRQENIKKLMEEPQRLKNIIQECRRTILNMENIISEQNRELELSIKAIEDNQQKLMVSENRLKGINIKLGNLQEEIKRQKLDKVQLSTLLEKQKQKNQICRSRQTKKNMNDGLNQFGGKEDRIRVCQGKEIIVLDFVPDLKYMDEYRIIATQAQTLEKCLKQQQQLKK